MNKIYDPYAELYNHLPKDTCDKCHKVMTNKEVEKYGHNDPCLCEDCMSKQEKIDNALVDIMIADLRRQGR